MSAHCIGTTVCLFTLCSILRVAAFRLVLLHAFANTTYPQRANMPNPGGRRSSPSMPVWSGWQGFMLLQVQSRTAFHIQGSQL